MGGHARTRAPAPGGRATRAPVQGGQAPRVPGQGGQAPRVPAAPGQAGLLDLQRQAGNRAVAGLIGNLAVQRNPAGGRVRADPVLDVEQVDGRWEVKLEGFTEAGAAAAYIWPAGKPAGVRIAPLVVLERPVQIGLFELSGITPDAMRTMDPHVAERFQAKGMTAGAVVPAVSPRTQYYEFDFAPDDPAHPDQIQLVSTPVTQRADYIDNRMTYLEYGLYLGGFNLYLDSLDEPPIFVSNRYLEDRKTSASAGDRIFDSLDEARASAAAFTRPGDTTPRHAYYWGAGGRVVAPTVFSEATTPRIMATLYAARAELARQVQHALAGLAVGIVGGRILGGAYNKAKKSFTGDPPPRTGRSPGRQDPTDTGRTNRQQTDQPANTTGTTGGRTPKTPPPAPRALANATTDDVAALKNEGFVFERVNPDGRTAVYRNPATGQRAEITLRQGGPGWVNPAWGRNRLEAELRDRGFMLARPTRGEGGLIYRNPGSGEEIRIMPKPGEQFRGEPIEKHLGGSYFRYRRNGSVEWGEHTSISDKN